MSERERLRLEQDIKANPNDLLVGATTNGLEYLERRQPQTLAMDTHKAKPLVSPTAVFATRSVEVAIFCATVYSRDGWSGWYSYSESDGSGELYEFFAAPRCLGRAVLAQQQGVEGSVYRARPTGFKPYRAIPGQFVAIHGDVSVVDEYRVDITDMRQRIANAAHLARLDSPRLELTRPQPPQLDTEFLLSCAKEDPPGYDGLAPTEVATALQGLQIAGVVPVSPYNRHSV